MQINPDLVKITSKPTIRKGFNRINSCRSIPTTELTFIPSKAKYKFQSYQFMQINPDLDISQPNTSSLTSVSIVSIHADQSRRQSGSRLANRGNMVSIVSIQADQSRRRVWSLGNVRFWVVSIVSIQADQSRPVSDKPITMPKINLFQSYQFRQINPDFCTLPIHSSSCSRFNRINSGRSIPTVVFCFK